MAVGDKQFVLMASQLGTAEGVASLDQSGILSQPQQPPTDSTPTQGSIKPVQSGGVYSSLLNKLSVPQIILPGTDLNAVTAPGMYYSENTNVPNAPNNNGAFSLLVENTGAWGGTARKQTCTLYNSNLVFTRILTFSGAGLDQIWTPWVQLATATPPQTYNLPLEDGIESNSGTQPAYFIDPFGIVTVSLSVYGVNALASGTVIAQLPEGFRPGSPNTICAAPNAFLSFDPPGNIILYTDNGQPVEANKWIVANVRFLASGN